MKKKLLLFVMMLLPVVASADAVEINGIYYNLNSSNKTAEVTQKPNLYSISVVNIPPSIIYNGVEYIVSSIGYAAFHHTYNLSSVTLPNTITAINSDAFISCNKLTHVNIPNSVLNIGYSAFEGCGITTITIGNNVKTMGGHAFYFCDKLKSIYIPESVISIGYDAFTACSSLSSVYITDLSAWCKISFETFYANPLCYANHLFLNGEEVKNVVIPNDINYIKDFVFARCSGLSSLTIHNGVTSIGSYAFYECKGLTSLTIPNSVINIGNNAFSCCNGLTSISIGKSVTSIGRSAFYDCSALSSVVVGSGVNRISGYAFYSCTKLKDFYLYSDNPPSAEDNAFYNSNIKNATLHVPTNLVDTYKSIAPWNEFKNIVALTDSDPKPTDTSKNDNTEGKYHKMIVNLKSGQQIAFALKDKPQISFNGSLFVVEASTGTIEYTRSDIDDFHFEEIETSVESIEYDGDGDISIYDMNGRILKKMRNESINSAKIYLNDFKPGIYIIKVGNKKSIKYLKK